MKQLIFIGLLFLCLSEIVTGMHLRRQSADKDNLKEEQKKLKNLQKIPDYSKFVEKLQNLLDNDESGKFRSALNNAILSEGKGLKLTEGNDKLNIKVDEKWKKYNLQIIPIAVNELHPTQNEIALEHSLKFPLSLDKADQYYGDEPKMIVSPIVTYNRKYVIDGHHRWSQLYMMNKNAKILAYNIEEIKFDGKPEEPESVLRRLQATIGNFFGMIPKSEAGPKTINVYGDLSKVKNYLKDKIINGGIIDDKEKNTIQMTLIQSMKKLNNCEETDDAKLKQKAYEFILENIVSLRDNNKPLNNAPNRDVMPQTDGGENFTKKKITPR